MLRAVLEIDADFLWLLCVLLFETNTEVSSLNLTPPADPRLAPLLRIKQDDAACRADGDFAALRPLLAELGLAPIDSAAEASEQRTACCNAYAAEAQTGAHQAVED